MTGGSQWMMSTPGEESLMVFGHPGKWYLGYGRWPEGVGGWDISYKTREAAYLAGIGK